MDRAHTADLLRRLHADVAHVRETPHVVAAIVYVASVAACIAAWRAGYWPLALLSWPFIAWQHHAALTRLHEAVHCLLSRNRRRNEAWGVVIGTLALTPMSVYRHVHARHHAWLGRPEDPEFRPYSMTNRSRAVRIGYALAELLLGFVVTPSLYTVRTAADWHLHRSAVRRRLTLEWLGLGLVWAAILVTTAHFGWWPEFFVGHLVPAWLAGVLQTLRKFTEHFGMHGDSIASMTRTIVARSRLGRLASRSQLFVDHHGTHHRWPRIPWFDLPAATPLLYADRTPTFATHLAALRDALHHLLDPKVGPQWQDERHAPKPARRRRGWRPAAAASSGPTSSR